MRRVTKAELEPHTCAVFPHLGSTQQEGYFDTQAHLPGPGLPMGPGGQKVHRVYVSVVAVKEMARDLGWISDEEAGTLRQEIETLKAELADMQERADAAEAVVDSIDVIESAAFRARKRTGRRPAQEKVVG